jgi:hypothetical protein
MECPHCRSSNFEARGTRYSLYPLGPVAIVGLPFALLHQVSLPRQYHFGACGVDFVHRSATAKVARFVLVAFYVLLGFAVAAAIIGLMVTQRR